ncbi:hypothetical protein CABS01_15914 [Colletotrichum abscissum]|uniref:uncharacterized protein n=1 Tax=Colletotrichum abscissum TaxID=1671311 RepID=UPI0027D68EFA|nr:uncharacterized protein CABS01_15914 [Colletotrichum abscissum]KAK1474324.1 hypothetical protein CABS01_15914 [Colletotrichum abscissum]KAK1709243.1 hypothetical protein BDP67DRAFT_118282 [Colletotrichum lupini]
MLAILRFVYFLSFPPFLEFISTLSMYLCMPCLSFYFSQTFNRGPGAKLSAKTWGALKWQTTLRSYSFHPLHQMWTPRPSRGGPRRSRNR